MTEPKKPAPLAKAVLEFGPALLFLLTFLALKNKTVTLGGTEYQGFVVATMVFVPVQVIATLILWRMTGKISVMQIMTLVLVVFFGGLTAWLNDPKFLEMKPTILYLFFAGLLGLSLALRRNWLQAVMGEALPMQPEGWRILTIRLVVLFLAMAALNEIVRHTMSQSAWVWFKTIGLVVIMFGFFIANAKLFERYALPAKDEDSRG
ncbi:inner membrane-spanning protein YciB [Paracoccus aminophilus]|uniref:Inner membrane-spanning protein YciB n=1 Tax=Paracoccus aminophilus JCM 7686 TaxID=1367847 RepID=S5XLI4_PARAH|nr:inner membrane-spanning protein YciB [Paracoccus aminophilus]AGT08049.1 intracellular septation protein A [Paracoccus aminophilus JCM 7686]